MKASCAPLLSRVMLSRPWGLQRAVLLLHRGFHGDVAPSGCSGDSGRELGNIKPPQVFLGVTGGLLGSFGLNQLLLT